jgi:flagellar motor protein MotB
MDKLADVMVRYGKTTLTIVGHTDDVGSNAYNQSLSERRALSVAEYLEIEARRLHAPRHRRQGRDPAALLEQHRIRPRREPRVEIYVEPVVQADPAFTRTSNSGSHPLSGDSSRTLSPGR